MFKKTRRSVNNSWSTRACL